MGNSNKTVGGRALERRGDNWKGGQGLDGSVTEAIDHVFDQVFEHLGPHAVFGEPIREGKVTVVPVAEARLGFGFGGEGRGRSRMGKKRGPGGGGGGGRIVPWGYIEITKKGASFQAFERPLRGRNWSKGLTRLAFLAAAVWGVATWASLAEK